MKKSHSLFFALLIANYSLLICNCEQPSASAPNIAPARAVLSGNSIEGIVGTGIDAHNITVSISGQALKLAIARGADLSRWITNLPTGLSANSTSLFPSGGGTVIITVEGTPLETRTAPLEITIPEGYLTEYKALPAVQNPGIRFYIVDPDATVRDVTVTWMQGDAPVNQNIEITLISDNFNSVINTDSPVDWIQNLPEGLTQKIKETVNAGSNTALVNVSGTPIEIVGTEVMEIEIPAAVLSKNIPVSVMRNSLAVFQIFDNSLRTATLSDVTINGVKKVSMILGALQEMPYPWVRDEAIDAKDFTLTLMNDTFKTVVPNSDVGSWFLNLPPGLSANSASGAASGGTALTITVSGTPNGTRKQPLQIKIPAAALNRDGADGDLSALQNAGAVFYIVDPNISLPHISGDLSQSTATLVGTKNYPVEAVDVEMTLENDELTVGTGTGTDATAWLTNIPAGLTAQLTAITPIAGKINITLRISGTPTEGGIARHMEITIPAAALKCGVAIRAIPEISTKFCIANELMTLEKAKEMVDITGGTVVTQPEFTYLGGLSSANSGTAYPREAGPFHSDNLPVTVPSFKIGKYEVTRALWYEVYAWSIDAARGDNIYNYRGWSWADPSSSNRKFFPITHISCQEAVVWCNAYSEKTGLTPVYYKTVSVEGGGTEDIVLRDKLSVSTYSTLTVHNDANGYRVPWPSEWEYAARGGVINGPQWNYKWPGSNEDDAEHDFPDVRRYAWVDQLRFYDVYNNEIEVGILLPNAAGIFDMAGNVHEWTVKTDNLDPSQTITRGGSNNRDASRNSFDSLPQDRTWSSSRDIIGLRIISHVTQ
jgi:formylglycine-generating enzyme required for sulfatase activity